MFLKDNNEMCIFNDANLRELSRDQTGYNEAEFLYNRNSRDKYICAKDAELNKGSNDGCASIGRNQTESIGRGSDNTHTKIITRIPTRPISWR